MPLSCQARRYSSNPPPLPSFLPDEDWLDGSVDALKRVDRLNLSGDMCLWKKCLLFFLMLNKNNTKAYRTNHKTSLELEKVHVVSEGISRNLWMGFRNHRYFFRLRMHHWQDLSLHRMSQNVSNVCGQESLCPLIDHIPKAQGSVLKDQFKTTAANVAWQWDWNWWTTGSLSLFGLYLVSLRNAHTRLWWHLLLSPPTSCPLLEMVFSWLVMCSSSSRSHDCSCSFQQTLSEREYFMPQFSHWLNVCPMAGSSASVGSGNQSWIQKKQSDDLYWTWKRSGWSDGSRFSTSSATFSDHDFLVEEKLKCLQTS